MTAKPRQRVAAHQEPMIPAPADHFRALVESSEDAILSKDANGIITSWNPAAERLYGYTADETIGQVISLLIPKHRRNEEWEILDKILAGERVTHYETERQRKDGGIVTVSLTVSPIRGEAGEIEGASVVARDVSQRRRARERAELLQQMTEKLSREATPERAIDVLLSEGTAALDADAGAIGLLDTSGEYVELAGAAGYTENGLSGWERFPLSADVPMSVAIRDRTPIWTGSAGALVERFPGLGDAEIRFAAQAVAPLVVEGRALGALVFSFREPRQFSAEDRAFVTSIAQQAAYTLDRARLFDAERRSRQQVEFLAEAGQVLSESLDVDATLERLAFMVVPQMGDWCLVELIEPGGDLRNVAVAHSDPEKIELAERLRQQYPVSPEAGTGVPQVIRTGEPELHAEVSDEVLRGLAEDEHHLELLLELGISSAMVVPLKARGKTLGALTLVSSDPLRRYMEADLRLTEDLARRAALAVDTSALYHREHETATTLQRALLPRDLPVVEGIEVAARYLPAQAGLEVGGDWYDVIEPSPGSVVAVIGDVAGHGVHAAAVMGRLRTGLRAYVQDGRSPGDAVRRLDELMHGFEVRQMATLFLLELNLETREVDFVRAGHPPALVRGPDGEVSELRGRGTAPLGVLEDVSFEQESVEVAPGSTILLYTDGLIERRSVDLNVGIDLLKSVLAEAEGSADACLEQVMAAMAVQDVPDDIATLALRVSD
jgi:PAS domain S-box-containing protein